MNPTSTKKLFSTPELIVYGDIRQITQGQGEKGQSDSGKSSNKTS